MDPEAQIKILKEKNKLLEQESIVLRDAYAEQVEEIIMVRKQLDALNPQREAHYG